ncbi:MAG: hypothetical protein SH809_05550 [Rhodothermales bacterium]|nr:hypothetical protein [Rhodothermales bacterium]
MKPDKIVKELEEVAQQLGLRVRRERGNFRGGRCTVAGKETIVLNRLHVPDIHVAVMAESLRERPLDAVFIKPAVRKALEEAWDARHARDAGEVDAVE